MKGNPKLIEMLNEILTGELTSINQYFAHAKMCEHWGYHHLYEKIQKESIDEMKHAEELIERILYLDGLPNLQRLGKVKLGESVPEMLKLDFALEKEAVERLNRGIVLAVELGDNGTRRMLESILRSEEDHIEWLEAQLALLEQVGESNYLAQQIRG